MNGYPYKYYASVTASGSTVSGAGWVQTTNGTAAPTGYIGIYTYLYKSGGTRVAANGWTYNSYATSGFAVNAYGSATGTFYALAYIRLYNGSSYNGYQSNKTPFVQNGSKSLEETLLEDVCLSDSELLPDGSEYAVLRAEGINGYQGFIRSADLGFDYLPQTPEEAVAYTLDQPDVRYIPVYGEDGITIVDRFPVYGGSSETVAWN